MNATEQRFPTLGKMCTLSMISYLITLGLWAGGVSVLRPGTIGWSQALWVSLGVALTAVLLILIAYLAGAKRLIWWTLSGTVPLVAFIGIACIAFSGWVHTHSPVQSSAVIFIILIFGLPALTWTVVWTTLQLWRYFSDFK